MSRWATLISAAMMRRIPKQERPRERLHSAGAEALSLRELLAVLIGTGPRRIGCLGIAARLLDRVGRHKDVATLESAVFNALDVDAAAFVSGARGLGPAGSARLLATYEIARRYHAFHAGIQAGKSPRTVAVDHVFAKSLLQIGARRRAAVREWFGFVPLSAKGVVGQLNIVAQGGRHEVHVDPGEFLVRVLNLKPRAVVLFHNHPSGSLRVSSHDRDLTQRLGALLAACSVDLLGHWIVTASSETKIEELQ